MALLQNIKSLMSVTQLAKTEKRLVIYSEGKNYWPQFKGIVNKMLDQTDITFVYISSDKNDPGLQINHTNIQTFLIEEGFFRDWLFQNIDCEYMLLTMPDLHQFQVKRSKHPVHYIYVQHSLVSLHMVYREGAFNYYDTICCAGPHHVEEMRAIEKEYNLKPKNLIEHGCKRFDDLYEINKVNEQKLTQPYKILLAPSWGENGTIESGRGYTIIKELLNSNYQVTLRPHPQTIRFAKNKIQTILNDFSAHELFIYEENIVGDDSLINADLLISDWSGIALEFGFGLERPVVFVDVPKKVNNPNYKKIPLVPFEIKIREQLGAIWDDNQPISKIVENQIQKFKSIQTDPATFVYNPGGSDNKIIGQLVSLLKS